MKKSKPIYDFMLKENWLGGLCVGIIGKEIFILMFTLQASISP